MSENSNDNDFYGSLAAAAEDSDSDAKAIQDMDDLEDDLFGSLLKKNRRGSGSPKVQPKLPSLDVTGPLAEKPSRPRAGRRRASVIDDDDLLDGLLPSDNETAPPTKSVAANPPANETAQPSVSFGSYVPSVSSGIGRTSRQAEPDNGTPRRSQARFNEDLLSTVKRDVRVSGAQERPVSSRELLGGNDGLDRVPQRERRSSLKDSAELQPASNREPKKNSPDLDWLTTGSESTSRRRGRSGELPWLDSSSQQTGAPKSSNGLNKREAALPHTDGIAPTIERGSVQTGRVNTALPFQQSHFDRQEIPAVESTNSHALPIEQVTSHQGHKVISAIPQEIKSLEGNIMKFASSLESKMSKIEEECSHIQKLLTNANETHAEQHKSVMEASRSELERLQKAGLDLETRLTKIHLDWKKDVASEAEEWTQSWSRSCHQLQSVQREWKSQLEVLQEKVRVDIAAIQTDLHSFAGKLQPLQVHSRDESHRKQDGVIEELSKLNVKIDRLVSQLELDRQLLLESRRPSDDRQTPNQARRSQPAHSEQQDRTQAKEEMLVHQIMEKINDLQEKSAAQLAERVQHLEKYQEKLSSSVSQLATDIPNSFSSASNAMRSSSLQAMQANEEQLLEWHSQLEEESQVIAAERIELARQKEAVQHLTDEIEKRFKEFEEKEASANKTREIGLQALQQAKQLDASWKERTAALNDQLEALQRKELALLQQKRTDKLHRKASGVLRKDTCNGCRETLDISPIRARDADYWTSQTESLLAERLSNIDLVEESVDDVYQFPLNTRLTQHGDGHVDSKVLMWNLLAVQDRKFLQEEQSYLQSLSITRTVSEF